MRPVITPAESERLDAAADDPVEVLMERAGFGLALAAVRMGAAYGTRVLALAGPGNNGGDAFVAARHLHRRGVAVEVRCLGFPKGEWSPARIAASAAARAGVPIRPLREPEPCDLLIDGLFGAGFRGSLSEPAALWVDHPAPVLAVDLPSGLQGLDGSTEGPVFTAARTVTFGALKVGHLLGSGPDLCGLVEIVDIGLPEPRPELLLCEDDDAPVPVRGRTDHKWSSGAVLVVGGSPGISGAVALTARSALTSGAGYVRAVVPWSVAAAVGSAAGPSITISAVPGDVLANADAILADSDRFDVMALGPGLGLQSGALVDELLQRWDRPLVLDADAIASATVEMLTRRTAPTVITPHGGEFSRLTGSAAGLETAGALAAGTGAVVVAKGSPTLVIGEERWVVATGGPELATLGTGDVLTGVVAAYIARGLDPETAARSAAHRHGLAGMALAVDGTVTSEHLADEMGRWSS
ncbi:NAD(P)H-hydrate dehydratase [bacterium]|nr:NAD(P)H-hydrate dehydratase [bacterium]